MMPITKEDLQKIYNPANIHLNETLMEKQKVTPEQKNELIRLHGKLNNEFRIAKELIDIDRLTEPAIEAITHEVKNIEFQMQDNWNFERDENKHKYWYRIPGCLCPVMDNDDAWGTRYHVVNNDCPYHGEGK